MRCGIRGVTIARVGLASLLALPAFAGSASALSWEETNATATVSPAALMIKVDGAGSPSGDLGIEVTVKRRDESIPCQKIRWLNATGYWRVGSGDPLRMDKDYVELDRCSFERTLHLDVDLAELGSWRISECRGRVLDLSIDVWVAMGIDTFRGTHTDYSEPRYSMRLPVHIDCACRPFSVTQPELPRPTVGRYFQQEFAQLVRGEPPIRFRFLDAFNGSPIPGVSLTEEGFLSGTPTEAGLHRFRIEVEDSCPSGPRREILQRSLYVCTAGLDLNLPARLPDAYRDRPYSYRINAVGSEQILYETQSTFPPGLRLGNGFVEGTPLEPGDYVLAIAATDQCGHDVSWSTMLKVLDEAGCQDLRFSSGPDLPRGVVGANYSRPVNVDGIPRNSRRTLDVTEGSLPRGITVNQYGWLQGTPLLSGDYAFTLREKAPPCEEGGPERTVTGRFTLRVDPSGEPDRNLDRRSRVDAFRKFVKDPARPDRPGLPEPPVPSHGPAPLSGGTAPQGTGKRTLGGGVPLSAVVPLKKVREIPPAADRPQLAPGAGPASRLPGPAVPTDPGEVGAMSPVRIRKSSGASADRPAGAAPAPAQDAAGATPPSGSIQFGRGDRPARSLPAPAPGAVAPARAKPMPAETATPVQPAPAVRKTPHPRATPQRPAPAAGAKRVVVRTTGLKVDAGEADAALRLGGENLDAVATIEVLRDGKPADGVEVLTVDAVGSGTLDVTLKTSDAAPGNYQLRLTAGGGQSLVVPLLVDQAPMRPAPAARPVPAARPIPAVRPMRR